MLSISNAYINVDMTETGSGTDFTIPGEHIESIDVTRRINRRKDEGTLVIHNDTGEYSEDEAQRLTLGDRLDVYVREQQAPDTYGQAGTGWGYGGWGGDRLVWSAWVEDMEYIHHSPTMSDIALDAEDYVFGVMSNRSVYDHFDNQQIAGSDDAIVNTVMRRLAPEIDLSRVHGVGGTTSVTANGTNLLEFMIDMQRRADARMTGHLNRLVFTPMTEVEPKFEIDPSEDIGTFKHRVIGSTVSNAIRVDGGTDSALDDENENAHDGYTTVTADDRLAFRPSTRKSQISEMDIWIRSTGSNDSVSVRLQKDDGGAPVAIEDGSSDIDSQQLSYEFLADDGFTTFLMNDHDIPEPSPWVILESNGSGGQDIGVDSSGDPLYQAWYPFPVSMRIRDNASINDHGRREETITRENISTLDEAREVANQALGHNAEAESEFEFPAVSRRAHNLGPGHVVSFDMPRERAVGDFIITETQQTYQDNTLTMTMTAEHVDAV